MTWNTWSNIQSHKINDCNGITLDMGRSNKGEPFPRLQQTNKTGSWQAFATVNRTLSSKSTLSGLPTKSLPDLGMRILSTIGQTGHKIPPKAWSKLRPKGKGLWNRECCSPSSSTRIKSSATAVAEQQHRAKIRMRHSCALGKPAELVLKGSDIFRKKFYEPKFLHLSILRQLLKPSPKTCVPQEQQ